MNDADRIIQQAMARPQAQHMAIAAPINDLQLMALMAADLYKTTNDVKVSVELAAQLLAAVVVLNQGENSLINKYGNQYKKEVEGNNGSGSLVV